MVHPQWILISLAIMFLLQASSSLVLLLNKWLVYKDQPNGWLYGITGAIVISGYFYLQMIWQHQPNLWIMIVYDIALVIIMGYGYAVAKSTTGGWWHTALLRWNVRLKVFVAFTALSVCSFLFYEAVAANLVLLQFLTASGGLLGSLCLAFKKRTANLMGWSLYVMAHCTCVMLALQTSSPILAITQVASGIIAVMGIRKGIGHQKTT
jgi:hypothetical protein